MKREDFSAAKRAGITALNGMLQGPAGGAATVGHDASSIYCKWAYNISNAPHEMPAISVTKALAAFDTWGVTPPAGLISKAAALQMIDRYGRPYGVVTE